MNREPFRHDSFRADWMAPRADATPQECFADEIAIDFPCVGQAVERMRDAFLGEDRAEVLATELRLSRIEARRGTTVPLEVPMRGTCPTCSGHGGTWRERCDLCSGSGESLYHQHVRVSLPPGVTDGSRFRLRVTSPHATPVRVELRVAVRSSAA